MSVTELITSKLFCWLFCLFVFAVYSFWLYQATSAYAYKRGWKDGLKDNANVVVVSEIIMDNYRVARFDPRTPGAFLLFDLEEKTIIRVPYGEKLEKQELVSEDADEKSK